MSAKKQTSKSKNTGKSYGSQKSKGKSKQSANSATSARSRDSKLQDKPLLSPRVKAILLYFAAAIFLVIIFIKGEFVFTYIRSFFFGVFGECIFLVPVVLVYLGIMTEKEKQLAHKRVKVILCLLTALFIGALFYIACGTAYQQLDYFSCLARLYMQTFNPSVYMTFGSGIFGGLLGYPLVAFGGTTIAIILCLVCIMTFLFILAGISVRDIGRAASRRMNNVKDKAQHIREHRTAFHEQNYEMDIPKGVLTDPSVINGIEDSGSAIDIPLDDKRKSKRRKKKSDVIDGVKTDITDAVEGNAAEADLSADLINIINRASKSHDFSAETTVDDIAKDITDSKSSRHISDGAVQPDPETVPVKTGAKKGSKTKSDDDTYISELDNAGYNPDDKPEQGEKIYHYPPVQLLNLPENNNDKNAMEEMQNNAKKLIETLNSFGVKAHITNICRGPSVTRYELQPAPGVKISKITNLSDDIALNLAANGVRIEAPIPGKAAVGIEVPNKIVSMVSLRELIDSDKFKSAKSKLTAVLGRDISGDIVVTDLSKMPHLLIAGTTGSGKSVCVNSLLMSILYKAAPDEVKLLLIDPKMVEFAKYRGIPHLLIPVVNDSKKAAGALAWAVNEMEQRYKILSEYGCKDIGSYNILIDKNLKYIKEHPPVENEEGEFEQPVLEVEGLPIPKEKMSSVVIAIDELADLMMTAPGEVEDSIQRLAQKARAAGMHLILATQRPTVNVITGTIKANIPSRISLKVSSNMDSRTILDQSGGEKLIGKGDMLFMPVGAPKPMRVQGCFATDEEIEGVTKYIKKAVKAQYNAEIEESIKRIAEEEINQGKKKSDNSADDGFDSDYDSLLDDAIKACIDAGQASTSLIQRKLRVGYARAGRIVDEMEQLGIVGPHQGSKPRDVIMTYNEWLERRNALQNQSD